MVQSLWTPGNLLSFSVTGYFKIVIEYFPRSFRLDILVCDRYCGLHGYRYKYLFKRPSSPGLCRVQPFSPVLWGSLISGPCCGKNISIAYHLRGERSGHRTGPVPSEGRPKTQETGTIPPVNIRFVIVQVCLLLFDPGEKIFQ